MLDDIKSELENALDQSLDWYFEEAPHITLFEFPNKPKLSEIQEK